MTTDQDQKHDVILSLGSNLSDRLAMLRGACEALAPFVTITARSPVYETMHSVSMDQPLFLNAIIRGQTHLDPMGLLYTVKDIELELGRQPTFHFGPRVIDIDIIAFDNLIWHSTELSIPHSQMAERLFVLQPLVDVAPDWQHPVMHKSASELLAVLPQGDTTIKIADRV